MQRSESSAKHFFMMSIVLITLIALVFCKTSTFEYLYLDDDEYVTENLHVNTGITEDNIRWAFTSAHSGHWHPLTWISLMIDSHYFGNSPAASHLINVALHALSMVLLFLFLYQASASLWRSFFVALIISVSPLRMESVAWISERKDVLSVFFAMLSLNTYVLYVKRKSFITYSVMTLFFIAGLLSKPSLVTLPLVFLLLDFWPLHRTSLTIKSLFKCSLEKIPLFILVLASCLVTIASQQQAGALKSFDSVPLQDRLSVVMTSYLTYLGKFFWPFNLGAFYPLQTYPSGIAMGAFLALLALTLAALSVRKQHPYILVGWSWFLISLLPVIGIVQVGGQQLADRWTYFPHIGIALAVVWFLAENSRTRVQEKILAATASVLILLLAFETYTRLDDWKNSETLFKRTLAVAPNNFFILNNLAVTYDRKGDLIKAAYYYDESLRFNPRYPLSLNNRGSLFARQGDFAQSVSYFEKALATAPEYTPARYHLGLAKERQGKYLQALAQWLKVLIQNPNHAETIQSIQFLLSNTLTSSCERTRTKINREEYQYLPDFLSAVSAWRKTAQSAELLQSMSAVSECLSS